MTKRKSVSSSVTTTAACLSLPVDRDEADRTAEGCGGRHRLWDALEAAEHIGGYELAYYADNHADFATAYHHLPAGFDIRWLDMVREAGLGAELQKRLGAAITEYGVVSAREKPLFELIPADGPRDR